MSGVEPPGRLGVEHYCVLGALEGAWRAHPELSLWRLLAEADVWPGDSLAEVGAQLGALCPPGFR